MALLFCIKFLLQALQYFLYHDMSLQEKNSILQMLKEENNGKSGI